MTRGEGGGVSLHVLFFFLSLLSHPPPFLPLFTFFFRDIFSKLAILNEDARSGNEKGWQIRGASGFIWG